MCNAGIYKDGDFCTALEVISAFNALAEKPDYQAKEFVVHLNDISADRIKTFKSIVSKTMCLRKNLQIRLSNMDVNDFCRRLPNRQTDFTMNSFRMETVA